MIKRTEKQPKTAAFVRTAALLMLAFFCQAAQAVPPLWEASYDVSATELDGSAGGATASDAPSGTRFGGRENIALGFNFPFGGNTYSNIVVDSDGGILLTNSSSNTANVLATIWKKEVFEPGFTNLGGGGTKPILLPFGTFMAQQFSGGKTYFKTSIDPFNGFNGNRAIITWENSSIAGDATSDITFQAQLFDDGTIIFSYQAVSAVANWNTRGTQGIVIGLSNGDGVSPLGSSDFSSGDTGIDLTGYQIWCRDDDPSDPADCAQAGLGKNSEFDLHDKSIVFNPDGEDGFLVSQSIEDGTGQGGSGVCPVSSEDAPVMPQLWDDSYDDVSATELDGTAGGATAGDAPSGTRFGGRENIALGFNFPFGGNTYSNILVDSDGGIILTNSAADTTNVLATIWKKDVFQPGFSNLGAGGVKPILLPFGTFTAQQFSDGKTYFKFENGTFSGFTGNRAVITWENSSLDGSSTKDISFQAILLGDGTIIFSYKVKSNTGSWDNRATQGIVVGISNGDGVFPAGSQNFSTYDFGVDLTGYEVWCRDDNPASPANCVQGGLGNNDSFDLDDRSIVFNPDGNSGFLVSSTIKDGTGNGGSGVCAEAPEPSPPVAVDDAIVATEDENFSSTTNLIANDSDADGDPLIIVKGTFTTAQGGKLIINNSNGGYTYKPPADFHGSDSVDYTLLENKSGGLLDVGTLNITVNPVNDAPVAVNDNIVVAPNTGFNSVTQLDANDSDVDGPALTVVPGTFPTNQGGSVTVQSNGSYSYTPPANYAGNDQVDYTVTDGLLDDIAALKISVTTENIDTLNGVLKSVKKLLRNKKVKKHRKSKRSFKRAKRHIKKAIAYLAMSDSVSAANEVDRAIKDLRRVKKKKSRARKLITELENMVF